MRAVIGALRVVLGMDSVAFERGATEAERRAQRLSRSMNRMSRNLQRAGQRVSVGLTAPLVAAGVGATRAMQAQERSVAGVEAALASMGDRAGFTSEQLQRMASDLQQNSLYGDEDILNKVTANLLTFGNIHGEVFERAQQMALDLSARLGTDLQSSALMLGKALNDPITGLTALTRYGVSFTEEQKETIKAMYEAGDAAGAQALMLGVLEEQYAGQAAALANLDSGRITQASNAIGDAMEKIGAVLLPIVAEFADRVKVLAERFQALAPRTQRFVVVAGALAAALGPVLLGMGLLMAALAPMAGAILAVVSPLGLLAAGVAAAGVAIYANWGALQQDFPAITGAISGALSLLRAAFDRFLAAAKVVFYGLQAQLRTLVSVFEALLSGDFRSALSAGVGAMRGFEQMLRDVLSALFGDLYDRAVEIAENVVQGLIDGFQQRWQDLAQSVTDLGTGIMDTFTSILGIRSPSRVFREYGRNIVDGLIAGVRERQGAAQGALAGLGAVPGEDDPGGFGALKDNASKTFESIARDFGRGEKDALRFNNVVAKLAGSFSQLMMAQGQSGVAGAAGGGLRGDAATAAVMALTGGLMGFANGGQFDVGGAGGIDSQIVAFRATPNETVSITKPGQGIEAKPSIVYAPNIDARGADQAAVQRLEAALMQDRANFEARWHAAYRDGKNSRLF